VATRQPVDRRGAAASGAADVAELDVLCRACDVEAVERGRAQIAAGEWEDLNDVTRDMEDVIAGRMESPSI
jgi:hypothetical protein